MTDSDAISISVDVFEDEDNAIQVLISFGGPLIGHGASISEL